MEKCNQLTPLPFKGLIIIHVYVFPNTDCHYWYTDYELSSWTLWPFLRHNVTLNHQK